MRDSGVAFDGKINTFRECPDLVDNVYLVVVFAAGAVSESPEGLDVLVFGIMIDVLVWLSKHRVEGSLLRILSK